ncbi:MAG TPA: hypothetical protein VIK91_07350 [Nannocystis sp.]
MEHDDAVDTSFHELEVIRITVPRAGHPSRGPWRGALTHMLRVSRACADEIEAKLERVHPEGRVARPRIYRGDRELDPPRGEDDDLGGGVEGYAAPDVTAADRQIVEAHRAHVALLQQQAGLLQRRIEELGAEAERARQRRDEELAKLQRMTESSVGHVVRVVSMADQHVEASMRRTFELDTVHQQQRAESLAQFAAGAVAVRQAREVLDSFMLRDSWADLAGGVKDIIVAALDSDLGKLAGMQFQTILAAKAAKWMDLPDMSPADVLAATLVTGARFRQAAEGVQRWAALHAAHPAGQAAGVVVSILRGDVGLEALEDLKLGGMVGG